MNSKFLGWSWTLASLVYVTPVLYILFDLESRLVLLHFSRLPLTFPTPLRLLFLLHFFPPHTHIPSPTVFHLLLLSTHSQLVKLSRGASNASFSLPFSTAINSNSPASVRSLPSRLLYLPFLPLCDLSTFSRPSLLQLENFSRNLLLRLGCLQSLFSSAA